MYVCIGQVFRENNITITYSSEFERFPSDGYIRSVMEKTKQEGRSESDSVSELEHNTVDLFTIFLWQGPGVLWRRNQGERLSSFFSEGEPVLHYCSRNVTVFVFQTITFCTVTVNSV